MCGRGYVVYPWGLAACVILGIDSLVTLKGACVCDIFLLVGFVDYLSPEEDWLTTAVGVGSMTSVCRVVRRSEERGTYQ